MGLLRAQFLHESRVQYCSQGKAHAAREQRDSMTPPTAQRGITCWDWVLDQSTRVTSRSKRANRLFNWFRNGDQLSKARTHEKKLVDHSNCRKATTKDTREPCFRCYLTFYFTITSKWVTQHLRNGISTAAPRCHAGRVSLSQDLPSRLGAATTTGRPAIG